MEGFNWFREARDEGGWTKKDKETLFFFSTALISL